MGGISFCRSLYRNSSAGINSFLIALAYFFSVCFSLHAQVPHSVTPAPAAKGIHKPASGETGAAGLAKRAGNQRFHVLAIRAEFRQDTVATTTGNGLFIMETDPGVTVDSPPHNREFFEDHMEALSRYYRSVSRGKVEITYEVYPRESAAVYKLPHQMQYYTPLASEELLDERLSELMRDALAAADTDPAIDFSAYNAFIIFHSGIGSDYSIDPFYNPTPNDVPSVFLDFRHLKRTLGKDNASFNGISVDDGAAFIREATILPETESKQGYEIGLNGIVAHQFGHQLGLPSLFNTKSGLQAIGQFSLMDVGFSTLDGLLPSQPCAWSKLYLGWEEPVEIHSGTEVPIFASLSADPRRIYKVPISREEYFLLENRQQDFAGDSIHAEVSPRGVLLGADDYDFGIPGSGILIWHIDERIIARGLEDNTVNADPKMRGVDLEEADGAEDIGEIFEAALPGIALPNNGIQEDLYYADNPIKPNPVFTPSSYPSSDANSRAKSHISITDFSAIDTVMTFSLASGFLKPGFPYYAGSTFDGLSPVSIRYPEPGKRFTAAVTRRGDIIVFTGDQVIPEWGELRLRPDISRLEDTTGVYVRVFATVDSPVTISPVIWHIGEETVPRLAVMDGGNTLHVLYLRESELDGGEDVVAFRRRFERPMTAELMASSGGLCLGDVDGRIFIINQNGNDAGTFGPIGAPIAGFAEYTSIIAVSTDGNVVCINGGKIAWQKKFDLRGAFPPALTRLGPFSSDFNIVVADSAGTLIMLDAQGNILKGFPRHNPEGFACPPALGDIDWDGNFDIAIKTKKSVYAYNHHGTLLTNFPITLIRGDSGDIGRSQPLLMDIDGDGALDIITGSANGTIVGFNRDGRMLDGFPFSTGQTLTATPFLNPHADEGGLPLVGIIAPSDDKMIYYWQVGKAVNVINSGFWRGFLGDYAHSSLAFKNSNPEPATGKIVLERGSVYNYPNPVESGMTYIRYKALYDAEITISIFDMVGEKIESFKVSDVVAGIDNEVPYNAGRLETGVYLVKVDAAAANGTEDHVLFKMAIVR